MLIGLIVLLVVLWLLGLLNQVGGNFIHLLVVLALLVLILRPYGGPWYPGRRRDDL